MLCALAPASVLAHATPVEMAPPSGAQLTAAPQDVTIMFSEHLEPGSSLITVTDQAGNKINATGAAVAADGRTLSVPVRTTDGLYTVSWSVVSKDDGHFTRGSYAFAVGSTTVSVAASEEMVKIATTKEAGLMFVEFLGNSLLWGVIALVMLSRGDARLRKPLTWLAAIAALCAAGGAAGQLVLKTYELAGLHGIGFGEAFHLYRHTAAGLSTLIRGVALTLGGVIVAFAGFRSVRTTTIILVPALLLFAYFRAIISHATANPFYPMLSIAVNVVHVIEKDLWLGVLLVLCALLVARPSAAREYAHASVNLLSANLAVLSMSAGYIVWLHLHRFENMWSSAWGTAAVSLFAAALALITIHTTLVVYIRYKPRSVSSVFPALLGAETAAAALVVFFTSIVIITSPPSTMPTPNVLQTDSNGVHLELSRYRFEDDKALLRITGSYSVPTVIIGDRDGGLLVKTEQRFKGGFVFPSGLISKPESISVIVPQENAYSADVTFAVKPQDFAITDVHGRRFDVFTVSMIAIAIAGVVLSIALSFAGRMSVPAGIPDRRMTSMIVTGAAAACVGVAAICVLASDLIANRFQAACIADGNMWHMMQPTKAGVPVAAGSEEGCMWGMGRYAYQFVDRREYEYLSTLGPAIVTLETVPAKLRAGVPTDMTVALKNADGSPATLLIDMEKYMHVVIVSEDESVFAHIHPDDERPLSPTAIDTSTYTVRYAFPKAGKYLVSVDYAHGTQLESKQFVVNVDGAVKQRASAVTYPSPGVFSGYTVSMDASAVYSGEVSTLKFVVEKDGKPVSDMRPYLSAVSHISVVKNDLTAFVHTHGEIHPPGQPYPPIVVRDGKIIHSMTSMTAPESFGPAFEAHVLFPSSGRYTVWAQFSAGGRVIPAAFTIDVE